MRDRKVDALECFERLGSAILQEGNQAPPAGEMKGVGDIESSQSLSSHHPIDLQDCDRGNRRQSITAKGVCFIRITYAQWQLRNQGQVVDLIAQFGWEAKEFECFWYLGLSEIDRFN